MTTMTNPFTSLVLAVVASASVLAFAAGPAEAAEVREARIEVSRFELSKPEGRAAVDARVLAAAEALCAEGGVDWKNLTEAANHKLCVATAVRDARTQMAAIQTRNQLAAAQ